MKSISDIRTDLSDMHASPKDFQNQLENNFEALYNRFSNLSYSINFKNYSSMHDLIVSRIDGDSYVQFYINASGSFIWGSGAAIGDTNLYRVSGKLKTDNLFIANGGIGVGNSLAATTLGSVSRKMEVFNATGASIGFVPIYSSIT